MSRKCEMLIGNKMIAGKYDEARDKDTDLWRWRFSYDEEHTRTRGQHIFYGFPQKSDCLVNARIMGVEFIRRGS